MSKKLIFTIVSILMLTTLTTLAFADTRESINDTEPPVVDISSLAAEHKTVGIHESNVISVRVTDESQILSVYYSCRYGDSEQEIGSAMSYNAESGLYTLKIDAIYAGQWDAVSIEATDIYGNKSTIYNSAYLQADWFSPKADLSAATFQVNNTSDTKAPVVAKITVNKPSVKCGDEVVVSMEILDESAINTIYISYSGMHQKIFSASACFNENTKLYDIPFVASYAGVAKIGYIVVEDAYGNQTQIFNSDSQASGGYDPSQAQDLSYLNVTCIGIEDSNPPQIDVTTFSFDYLSKSFCFSISDTSYIAEIEVYYSYRHPVTGKALLVHGMFSNTYTLYNTKTQQYTVPLDVNSTWPDSSCEIVGITAIDSNKNMSTVLNSSYSKIGAETLDTVFDQWFFTRHPDCIRVDFNLPPFYAKKPCEPNNHIGNTKLRDFKEATCTENGYSGDVYCENCDEKLSSGTVIAAKGHSGGVATCRELAKCTICGEPYGQLNTQNHTNLKHFPARDATTRREGNIEYWYCDGCNKYYADAMVNFEVSYADVVITKLPNSQERRVISSITEKETSPKTFDAGVGIYVMTATISASSIAWLCRKRKSKNELINS